MPRKSWNSGPKSTLNPISPDSLCYPLPANHHFFFYRQASEWMTMNLLLYGLESTCLNVSEVLTNLSLSTHTEIPKEDILYLTCHELLHLSFPSSHQVVCSPYHSPFMNRLLNYLTCPLLPSVAGCVSVCHPSVNCCTQLKMTQADTNCIMHNRPVTS